MLDVEALEFLGAMASIVGGTFIVFFCVLILVSTRGEEG